MSRGPEQDSHYLSIQETTEHRKGFPPPAHVARAALAEIQPDGSVSWDTDDETGDPVFYQPKEPVDLDNLAPDTYARKLFSVAWAIRGTVNEIAFDAAIPDPAEIVRSDIRQLAHYLSAYRHDPAFVDYAASLVHIDEHGGLHDPALPKGSPWDWVPQLRTDLAYQNAARMSAQQT